MTTPFSGGCACGSIRFECTAEPAMMLHCHCRDCQRASGGPFVAAVAVPVDALQILQGSPRFYGSPSDAGGQHHRGFCVDCGSPLFAKFDALPHLTGIRIASVDDPSWFRASLDMWTSDAQPWDQMDPALPKFEKHPPFGQ